jgi:ribonuclease HI
MYLLIGIKPGDITPIILPVVEDYTRDAFRCYTPKDRDTSIRIEAADRAPVKVYTDGSAMEEGVGAAAVLYDKLTGRKQVRRFHLGKEADHTNYEAEVVGLMLAIHQISELPQRCIVSVYSDSQSLLKAINLPPDGSAGYLIQQVVAQMKALRERRPLFAKGIIFRWISAHSNVPGNEAADIEAKKAAAGHSSRKELLPSMLTRPLPISSTSVRHKFREAILREWAERRRKSPRIAKLDRIDPSFSPPGFQKLTGSLNRNSSTILNRIRSGHLPTNEFLHRINKADSPICPSCKLADETIRHVMYECPEYRQVRRERLDGLGRNSRDTQFLLSTKKGAEALTSYLKGTKRFEPVTREGVG